MRKTRGRSPYPELIQRLRQRLDGLHIQMVGRLIQDVEVGAGREDSTGSATLGARDAPHSAQSSSREPLHPSAPQRKDPQRPQKQGFICRAAAGLRLPAFLTVKRAPGMQPYKNEGPRERITRTWSSGQRPPGSSGPRTGWPRGAQPAPLTRRSSPAGAGTPPPSSLQSTAQGGRSTWAPSASGWGGCTEAVPERKFRGGKPDWNMEGRS